MNANSRLSEATLTHALYLERMKAGESQNVLRLLSRLERSLIADLQKSGLTSWRKSRYERLLAQTRDTIRGTYRAARDQQQSTLQDVAQLEEAWTVRSINGALSEPIGVYVDFISSSLSPMQLRAIASNVMFESAPLSTWWAKQSTTLQQDFARVVKDGLLRGTGTDAIVKALREAVYPMSRAYAETLVRTGIAATSSVARRATYKENRDLIKGIQHLSTLDSRTSVICTAYDLKMFTFPDHTPIGHQLPYKHGVPRHPRCRSTESAVLKSYLELGGKPLPQADDKTLDTIFRERLRSRGWSEERIAAAQRNVRSSMNGAIPAETTMTDFLKDKGSAFQDEQLGKTRADLFRRGFPIERFLDGRGNPLTVKQLQQHYGGVN